MSDFAKYRTIKELSLEYNVPGKIIYDFILRYDIKRVVARGVWLKYLKNVCPEIEKCTAKLILVDKKHLSKVLKEKPLMKKKKDKNKELSINFTLEEKLDLLLSKIEEIKSEIKEQNTISQKKEMTIGDIKFEKDQILKLTKALRIYGRKQINLYKKLEELTGEDLHKRSRLEEQICFTKGYSKSVTKRNSLMINIILEDDKLRKTYLDILYKEEKRIMKENLLIA